MNSSTMRNLRIISQTLNSLKSRPSLIPIQSRTYSSSSTQSENVTKIVTEVSNLTLLETMDLNELLRKKLNVNELPVMASMMPGMALQGSGGRKGGDVVKGTEKKVEEKTAFDLMLQSFDAAMKLKVIKEVRSVTNLGLKEAKDLVEKAPSLLTKGVAKEEAEKIVEKLKAVGAKVSME